MSHTPNLLITEVAANQSQKEVTINNAILELEAAVTALLSVSMSDADYTLSTTEDGEAYGHAAFIFTGTLSANRNIVVPATPKFYLVQNDTTAGGSPASDHDLIVKTPSGTGVTVAKQAGQYAFVYCDGTNVIPVLPPTNSSLLGINTQTSSYHAALSDAQGLIRMNVGTSNTVTIDPDSTTDFPVGSQVTVRQVGTGTTTIAAGAGVTITSPSTLSCRVQYSTAELVKVATDTWDLMGDVA